MKRELEGKRVLVTGAASGIGAACATLLSTKGARLILADRAPFDNAVETLPNVDVAPACDVSDEQSVVRLFESIDQGPGGPDSVIHCAGILSENALEDTTAGEFDRMISVNLRGTFLVGREALPRMRSAGGGSFVAVSSELAYPGRAKFSAYCASKAGVLGLVRSWAREFAPDVRVNALAPGPVDTPMLGLEHISAEALDKETEIPLGRVAQAEEIAAAAAFLVGPGASFMTGQTVSPNGGAVMF